MADKTEIYRTGSKIVFVVDGQHTTEAARHASAELINLAREIAGAVEFVADLRKLNGFTSDGRQYWQSAFKEVKGRVKLITLVGGSPMARVAASAVGLYAGIKVRSVDTLERALMTGPGFDG